MNVKLADSITILIKANWIQSFFILNFVPIKNENSVSMSLPKNWDNSNDPDYLTYDHVIQS